MSYPKQPCCNSAVEAAGLRLHLLRMEEWWHREWHQATGIPCDGGSEYCPLPRSSKSDAYESLIKQREAEGRDGK